MPWRKPEHHPQYAGTASKTIDAFLKSLKHVAPENSNIDLFLRAFEHSERLHRWVDIRQPTVEDLALPPVGTKHPGPNVFAPDWYKDTWESFSNWVSQIHQDSHIGCQGVNFVHRNEQILWDFTPAEELKNQTVGWIKRMNDREEERAYPLVLQAMRDRFPGYNHYTHAPGFDWVFFYRRSLWLCLDELYAIDDFFSSQGQKLSQYYLTIERVCHPSSLVIISHSLQTIRWPRSALHPCLKSSMHW